MTTIKKQKHKVHVFTYGYCCNNNKRGSRAAIGVYVQGTTIHESYNMGMTTSLYNKQTSETASLLAVQQVIDASQEHSHPLYKYFKSEKVTIVVHVDTKDTVEWCTGKGKQLEREGFPLRSNIHIIRSLYQALLPLRKASKVRIVLSDKSDKAHYQNTMIAKRLAKDAIYTAITETEKKIYYLNSHYGMCMYDDGPRYNLNVPLYDQAYAISKGAWWDDEHKTFFVYKHDVGCHYDMRLVDYINLRNMYDSEDL